MTAMQGALSAAERSMRSVFVGNIPYEATEEQLKDIFSEVGPVVSFRLVYDRETGKPKGYGFCEYKDQEMALSAMRNLNGYELNGRPLRVDNAASEKSKEELKNLQASLGGPPVESPFGAEVSPDKAPEAIAKIIASLPPEQMYELMTQMKVCIENNPNEARNLLLQNPQLCYALLQCQVVMKIVEPEVAMGMIHRSGPPVTASGLLPNPDVSQVPPVSNSQMPPVNEVAHAFPAAVPPAAIPPNAPVSVPRTTPMPPSRPSLLGDRPPAMPPPPAPAIGNQFPDRDQRMMGDHDLRQPPLIDHDMRPPPMLAGDKDMRHPPIGDQDFRALGAPPGLPEGRQFNDPRFRNMQGPDMGPGRGPDMGPGRGPDMGPGRGPDMGPGRGHDMGPGRGHDMGPGRGPDMGPGRGPDMGQSRGPDMGPGRGPDMGQGRGPDMGPGRGPDMGPGRGPDMGPGRGPDMGPGRGMDFGPGRGPDMGPGRMQPFDRQKPGMPSEGRPGFDGRGNVGMSPRMEDPRGANMPPGRMPPNPRMGPPGSGSPHIGGASPSSMASPRPGSNPLAAAAAAIAPHDQEKANLIMQVLQLTDQQIAMLHPEQRQSIMVLKEQIARSQQGS